MRFQVQHAASKRKSIQLTMVILLLVSLFLAAVPVRATEEDGNSAKDEQEIYQKLKTGKRLQQEEKTM